MIGDSAVGKTSLMNSLVGSGCNESEAPTVGAAYVLYTEEIDGERVAMQIWDTAGQEQFRSIAPVYYRSANAAIVVFSKTDMASFEHLQDWISVFVENANRDAIVIVACNKDDCTSEHEVTVSQAQTWADEHGHTLCMTSAKTGDGVDQLFKKIALKLIGTGASQSVISPIALVPGQRRRCFC